MNDMKMELAHRVKNQIKSLEITRDQISAPEFRLDRPAVLSKAGTAAKPRVRLAPSRWEE